MTPLGDPKTSWLTPEWGAKERFHRATSGFFEHAGLGDSSFLSYWLAATLPDHKPVAVSTLDALRPLWGSACIPHESSYPVMPWPY